MHVLGFILAVLKPGIVLAKISLGKDNWKIREVFKTPKENKSRNIYLQK